MKRLEERDTSSWSRAASARREKQCFVPHDYQMQAMKFMVSRPAAGLFLDPGFGKTAITLHVFDTLRTLGHVDALLVLAKLRIVENTWPDEIAKWGMDIDWTLLHGPKKEARLREQHHAYFMNYEGLSWLSRSRGLREAFKGRRVMLVCDESSKLKDTRTQRFKSLKSMLPLFARRYILTGTPAPQSLMDLFGQVFVLDMGETFGPYVTHFRNMYFMPSGYMGHDWKLREGAEQAIYEKTKPLVLRLPRTALRMPDITYVNRYVRLPAEARQAYDEVEEQFVGDLASGRITAVNAAVAAGKLRQIAGGSVYDDVGAVHYCHDEKLDALQELIEELEGQPVFVAYEYQHELARILQRLPHARHIGSGVTASTARAHIEEFNAGRLRILLGHPQSVAHGLNLQASARTVIFYTLPWSLENYEQFIRRVWRQGQQRDVVVYQLIARETIDEAVIKALGEKDASQRALLSALESHYRITAKSPGRRHSR